MQNSFHKKVEQHFGKNEKSARSFFLLARALKKLADSGVDLATSSGGTRNYVRKYSEQNYCNATVAI